MAEEDKSATTGESTDSSTAKRSRLPLIAGAVVAVLLLAGGGTFFVLRKGDPVAEQSAEHAIDGEEHAAPAEHASEGEAHGEGAATEGDGHGGPPAPQFVLIDPFVVNIKDGERDRFLKLKIDLEVSNAQVSKEIAQRMPQIKDIMIGLLSSQDFASVRTLEGKDQLREQVQTRINAVVRTGVVRQVLFTEFVVQ